MLITNFANIINQLSHICNISQIWEQKRQTSIDKQGKTRKWLAGQLGKNETTISRWCSNTSQPSLEMLMKIASILGISSKDLTNNGINNETK
ncbi:helix-turn-helix transcriptional regulator [Paraprevotella xylaniphila]|uniref:helix-turn-helix transcriptional regulator n=1 Tax=Paraprevotella xylaniphila TaxID=454155 RepID=UPI003FD7249C